MKAQKLVLYFVTFYIAMSFFAYPPSPPSFSGLGVGNAPRLLALHKPWSGWAVANIKHQTSLPRSLLAAAPQPGGPRPEGTEDFGMLKATPL